MPFVLSISSRVYSSATRDVADGHPRSILGIAVVIFVYLAELVMLRVSELHMHVIAVRHSTKDLSCNVNP